MRLNKEAKAHKKTNNIKMKQTKQIAQFLIIILFSSFTSVTYANNDTEELQRILDSGKDLILEKNRIYEIDKKLVFVKKGQRITTGNSKLARDFATLKVVNPTLVTIISAEGIANIVIENIKIDGNRDYLKPEDGVVLSQPFISLGKLGGDDQLIQNCIITNARCSGGWAAIHIHEDAFRTIVRNNIIFGVGVDVLGNGRSNWEKPFTWGDGISVAANGSLIENNLVIDPTDEGIMVQGAANTKVLNNVVVSLSREALAGIALIDPAAYSLMDPVNELYDYTGVLVKNNIVHALGSRVHIGYACGKDVWFSNKENKVLVGAKVVNNKFVGNVGAYGFAVAGVKDFKICGNKVNAVLETAGDGMPNNPPNKPEAFVYDPAKVSSSKLQSKFVKTDRHLVHLLRNFSHPKNELGYRELSEYGSIEAKSIVFAAFIELLNRAPQSSESQKWESWLQKTKGNADGVRSALINTQEFIEKNGSYSENELQKSRSAVFYKRLENYFPELNVLHWPKAKSLHAKLFKVYLDK